MKLGMKTSKTFKDMVLLILLLQQKTVGIKKPHESCFGMWFGSMNITSKPEHVEHQVLLREIVANKLLAARDKTKPKLLHAM